MSAFEESLALVAVALEEEELDFAPLNFRLELMEADLVLIHEEYRIPLEF